MSSGTRRRWPVGLGVALPVAGTLAVRRWRRVTSRLFDLEVDAETTAVRERVRESEGHTRHHDLANAVAAVEGANRLLDRDAMSPHDRESLRLLLDSGIERLRDFVLNEQDPPPGKVRLAEVARLLTDDPRWSECNQVDVPAGLVAVGSPGQTVEAARQLLSYLSQQMPGRPITVRGEHDTQWAILWLEVRTPAISGRRRRSVVDSSRRPSGGGELALHTASRLLRGQGGELRIEHQSGGGRSFGMSLPLTAEP